MNHSDTEIIFKVITGAILIIGSITVLVRKFVINKPTDYSLKKGSNKVLPLIILCNIMIISEAHQNHSELQIAPIIAVTVTATLFLFLDKLLPSLIAFYRRKIGRKQSPR